MRALLKKDKKGMGLVTGLIAGVAGLIITVIVTILIVDTMIGAGILTSGGASETAANDMSKNFTTGLNDVSEKIPTILLISAVVILFGAIVILVQRSRAMTAGGGGL